MSAAWKSTPLIDWKSLAPDIDKLKKKELTQKLIICYNKLIFDIQLNITVIKVA